MTTSRVWRRSRTNIAPGDRQRSSARDRARGRDPRTRIFRPDGAPRRRWTRSRSCTSTAGRSVPGRGVQRLGRRHTRRGRRPGRRRKTMFGGTIAIMKGRNRLGRRVNGSIGKSFAYGAQRGRFFVQGSADSLLHQALGGDVDRRRAGRPDRRRARWNCRPRQHQGLRVRVHDVGPCDRAGRHRSMGVRRL